MGRYVKVTKSDYVTVEELIRFCIDNQVNGFHSLQHLYKGRDKNTNKKTETNDILDLKKGTARFLGLEAEIH